MVDVLDIRAEQLLAPEGVQDDRQIGRFFYKKAQGFLVDNALLLPELYGLVAQQQTETDKEEEFKSVVIDVRDPSLAVWQITTAKTAKTGETTPEQENGREVIQLSATREGVCTGWKAIYDAAGRLTGLVEIAKTDFQKSWDGIEAVLSSEEVKKATKKMEDVKLEQEETLGMFALARTFRYTVPASHVVDPKRAVYKYYDKKIDELLVVMEGTYSDEKFIKELEKRKKTFRQLGFALIAPQPRPKGTSLLR